MFKLLKIYWEFVMMFVLIVGLILIPIESSYTRITYFLAVPKATIDGLFFIDVVVTFFTGYYEETTLNIVLKKSKIVKKYLFGLFIFDFLGCLNPHLIIFIVKLLGGGHNYLHYVKMIQIFKILRIPTMLNYMDSFREYREYSIYVFKVIKLVLVPLILLLWLSFLNFYISDHFNEQWLADAQGNKLLHCFLRTLIEFLLISYGNGPSQNLLTLVMEMLTMLAGLIFKVFVLSQALMIVNKYNASVNKYYQMMQGLHEYAEYMRLPDSIRQKVFQYFEVSFQKTYYKESEIFETISDNLRHAIVMHSCKSFLNSVDIFKDLPAALLIRIVTNMKSEIYLPEEVIVYAGTEGDTMFFIVNGTVAIYTTFGKEVCHLADGAHFGEIALMMNEEKRVASVVAIDPCELYTLKRKDFHKAIEPYPDLYYRIKKMAQERFQRTMEETVTRDSSDISVLK